MLRTEGTVRVPILHLDPERGATAPLRMKNGDTHWDTHLSLRYRSMSPPHVPDASERRRSGRAASSCQRDALHLCRARIPAARARVRCFTLR